MEGLVALSMKNWMPYSAQQLHPVRLLYWRGGFGAGAGILTEPEPCID